MGTVTKEPAGKQDIRSWYDNGDGDAKTFSRQTSEGYNLTLRKLDWVGIDAMSAFGGNVLQDSSVLEDLMTDVGASDRVAVFLAPGKWQITKDQTITGNLVLFMPPGAYFDTDITIRSSAYKWTLSGSGTNEYYLEASAGGDPGINQPSSIIENGTAMTAGAVGGLAAGEWAWDDNDTLGYDTVYVRLSDNVDPDTKAANYVLAGYTLTVNAWIEAGPYQIVTGYGTFTYTGYDNSDNSTSGGGEDNLASSTIPAYGLGTKRGILVKAAGTKTGLNGNKTLKFYFGTKEITVNLPANNEHDWQLTVEIWNTATNAQRIAWEYIESQAGAVMEHRADYDTAAIDTTSAVTVKMTGTCANASDTITQTIWRWNPI